MVVYQMNFFLIGIWTRIIDWRNYFNWLEVGKYLLERDKIYCDSIYGTDII